MWFLYIIISLELPLRMPRILLTTPINAYAFYNPLDTPEDFFLSYPALKIKNDTLYFKGYCKVLLLLDGVITHSLSDVCFLGIEKVEVVAQDASSLYGDYDAVVNIITKKNTGEVPYSRVRLYKNPDYVEFEFGRYLYPTIDFYLTSNLGPPSKFNTSISWTTKFATLRANYINEFILHGALFSKIKFYLKQDLFSVTNLLNIKGHKILLGTENGDAFFIQDYWEPYPLLYAVPSLRYEAGTGNSFPRISVGFIPHINVIVFSSLTPDQTVLGVRVQESNFSLFRYRNGEYEIETRFVSPWVLFGLGGFRLTSACYIPLSDYQAIKLLDYSSIMLEYRRQFKEDNIGVYVLGDLNNLRLELKIIDVRVFYRMQKTAPCFGLSWEFWE